MKRFEERRTDFGRSDKAPPHPMRLIDVTMLDGEVWRVELEPDEIPTEAFRQILEDQANIYYQTVSILYGDKLKNLDEGK